jgi:hypothetical protein
MQSIDSLRELNAKLLEGSSLRHHTYLFHKMIMMQSTVYQLLRMPVFHCFYKGQQYIT